MYPEEFSTDLFNSYKLNKDPDKIKEEYTKNIKILDHEGKEKSGSLKRKLTRRKLDILKIPRSLQG